MSREIRLNAFDMNCVGHQSPGLWRHPRDQSWTYKDLNCWVDLAQTLERGGFDRLSIADVLGVYDVLDGTASLSFEHPYTFARRISTPDHLTKGRVGWNIVASYLNSGARSIGQVA